MLDRKRLTAAQVPLYDSIMQNFLKIRIQNDRLGGWSGAGGYAVLVLEVFAATFVVLLVLAAMAASAVISPVLLLIAAPLVFAGCVANSVKIVKHARSVKTKIDETVEKIKDYFFAPKPAGLLLKLTPLETLTRVSAIFEVQTPPPRAIRPV